ncbi:ArnT family glycosyltransferase [Dictyobacter formicarum]|uniref:Dolichyl-phosphate-mannose--protein mannosyltransferase n=1 Tax=Dictyobacter formicarum TaxID=2778368 RepID=A0ABQ3VIZ2_9CHLR|nr:glycosyltransferase family 39 protein [Dictyobacter formicarum]GHO85583.1 dolichyl-phosphate-mannose--protein mannosyltransferase [Dictyobacter formicarum]
MSRTMITSPAQVQKQTQQLEDSHQPMLLWHKLALGTVLAISVFFNFFALDKQDFFEYYYAASIKSMLLSWHNLFFAAFDPAGFLALDKPPLGFWIQMLSVRLFGFSVFTILLPEALAGVLAVAVMFHLVRRVFGPLSGLIAALALALSPISIATNRTNIIDSLLVLAVLLATWLVNKATETGHLRWLCLCAILLGLGFNIKYLQAYMVLPAFGLAYWLGSPLPIRTKLYHCAVALGILLLISLCWVTIVDLTPTNQRPYIDSITTQSELDLAFGYNGAFRLNADDNVVNNWAWEIGRPGIARFFGQPVAGQCSWLLPLALFSLLALNKSKQRRLPLNRQDQALVLWGTWLFTLLAFFSSAHFFHLYYLSMLAPAIAALVGAGIVMMWHDYCRYGWRGWLLPCSLLLTGITQALFLTAFPMWSNMLAMVITACSVVLALMRWQRFPHSRARQQFSRKEASRVKQYKKANQHTVDSNSTITVEQRLQQAAMTIVTLGVLSLLLAPTAWAAIPLNPQSRVIPMAGPPVPQTHIPPLIADPVLLNYLLDHKGKAQFLLATMNTEAASPFIVDTSLPVMALGGYSGITSFLTREQLIQRIDHGLVRFFLLPESNDQTASWVFSHCRKVPTKQWQSRINTKFSVDALTLYDCSGHS